MSIREAVVEGTPLQPPLDLPELAMPIDLRRLPMFFMKRFTSLRPGDGRH